MVREARITPLFAILRLTNIFIIPLIVRLIKWSHMELAITDRRIIGKIGVIKVQTLDAKQGADLFGIPDVLGQDLQLWDGVYPHGGGFVFVLGRKGCKRLQECRLGTGGAVRSQSCATAGASNGTGDGKHASTSQNQ